MSARKLVLEILTPDGPALTEHGLDAVVLRRREARFELGSEIAILPLHAPTLIRMSVAPLRYRRGGQIFYLAVGGGFVEVERDRVLVVTPRCERPAPGEPDPRSAAQETCRTWRRERVDSREAMAGYPEPIPVALEGRRAPPHLLGMTLGRSR
ncbi:MAG TPA: hypothetical protein VLT82_17420 [Myxococcaceae bacterium]|nr:hypothetical protein [Myxococcaceae bacterium]